MKKVVNRYKKIYFKNKIALDFSIEGLFLPYFFLLSSRQ